MPPLGVLLLLVALGHSTQGHQPLPIRKAHKFDWWERGNFYQIYPRSFKDSDGDGIGDLKGITQTIEYLKTIGIDGVWLSPIFKSPMNDFGYDISDFYAIQEEYGTMEDFEELAAKCASIGLKLILDFVPNHSSDEHEHFRLSEEGVEPYKDYYIWHSGVLDANGTRHPPSNWISVFRGSAWQWSDKRQQYYLHQFQKKQPDLNYRNPALVEEMKNVMRFWLNKGIAGFRIDALPYLFESEEVDGHYRDEPLSGQATDDPDNPAYLTHTETKDQPETYDMVHQWRQVVDEYTARDNFTRIILTEAYTAVQNMTRFYGTPAAPGAQIPFNFQLITLLTVNSTGRDFVNAVQSWTRAMPSGAIANWVLGNHDNSRIASRLGVARADLYNIALQTLPGIAVTYYGEEIAMVDQWISWNDTIDPAACNADPATYELYSRDPVRTPFQWSNGTNAGFSNASRTWLPVADGYRELNVAAQLAAPRSHLKTFMQLTAYRKRRLLAEGSFVLRTVGRDLVMYKRSVPGVGYVVVALNFGSEPATLPVASQFPGTGEHWLKVIASSLQAQPQAGTWINTRLYKLAPDSGIVLERLTGRNDLMD
ncbi:probable maltase [Anopheles arabiensis]|uniref:alpha-glucosidase n=1 Tax=Anopheles arabiensis TaxID=7173 RepID=A0A2C9GRJ1_ANOAR|nr:probable maltase [Anopheles arabiensis]